MIITDGHHLPASFVKAAIRAKGVEKIIVVSDAAPPAGLPPGQFRTLGNNVILDESGRLYNPDKQCLVGSSATMLKCMNWLASLRLLSLEELLAVGFHNPLELIKLAPEAVSETPALFYDDKTFTFLTE